MVYYGAKVESIRTWVENNKRIMRLLAGIIMAVFAVLLIRMGLP
jgi:hypothetical protein